MTLHSDDKRLAARMARGDAKAYEEFLDTFGARVLRLARRYTDCEADAEDVTQEIFVDLVRGVGAFRGEAQLSTWVYRIAMNHCLKHRGRNRPSTVPYDDALNERPDPAADPERSVTTRELSERVYGALTGLSDGHREVVILHELEGKTYAECAEILGIPIGTVKSRLSNAFRRLRVSLGAYVLGDPGNDENTKNDVNTLHPALDR